ncbi:MAG: 30S ribosome-binding factor RbfA [Oscillospiraceae bacterium]|nr:30S ribosome-binding factor RbfA [Oscillospiraceae bacterium]
MASGRISRINEEIMRELSTAIRSLKDPRVQGMITITGVDTSSDLRTAKVYVSVYDKSRSKEVIKGLKSAGGYLRRHLGSTLQLRYTPELVFEEDHAIEHGARIFDILATLDIPEDESNDETTDE